MELAMNAQRRALYEAQQRIFNKLCAAFRRSRQDPEFHLLSEDVRSELNIPLSIFNEALERFNDAAGDPIVIVIEDRGERYIMLGESAKSNVSDWVATPREALVGFRSATPAESTRSPKYGLGYAGAVVKNR